MKVALIYGKLISIELVCEGRAAVKLVWWSISYIHNLIDGRCSVFIFLCESIYERLGLFGNEKLFDLYSRTLAVYFMLIHVNLGIS